MRVNMNNHFSTTSVNADMENTDDDVKLNIRKFRGIISKRIYYKLKFSYQSINATLVLNSEQLEQLAHSLEVYVKSGDYKKRVDSKKANYEGLLWVMPNT